MPKRKLDYHPLTLWNVPDVRRFFREEESGLYSYMFVEDVTNHVMPYGTRSSRSDKSFKVNINNPFVEMEIKTLFHMPYGNDSYYQPLSESIFEFIRRAAGFLLVRGGRVYFEIVDATIEDEGVSKPVFVLNPIHGKVVRIGGTYYQMIPKDVQDGKKKYIPVPQSKIWALELSKDLGRVKDIIVLSNNMRELGKASLLGSDIITSQKDFFGFEFSKFHKLIDAKVLQVTEKWGWDMRMGLNNQHALEYFLFYRMLRFNYSMSILRTDMLSKMNVLLNRLGYDVTMSFFGIPAPEDYLDAIKKMEQRQLSFNEASNLIHFSL